MPFDRFAIKRSHKRIVLWLIACTLLFWLTAYYYSGSQDLSPQQQLSTNQLDPHASATHAATVAKTAEEVVAGNPPASPPVSLSGLTHSSTQPFGIFALLTALVSVLILAVSAVIHYLRTMKHADAEFRIAATAFEAQESMVITDHGGRILKVNRAFTELNGYRPEESIGHTLQMLCSDRHDAKFYTAIKESVKLTGAWRGEIWSRSKDGELTLNWLTISAVKGAIGTVSHYVATQTDIGSRRAAAAEIEQLAFFDSLTGLPNRRLLLTRLREALSASARTRHAGALLFIDMDNFKALNDTLGHDQGDNFLQQVAQRLTACLHEGATVARFGGDEFVVLLENLSGNTSEASQQVEAIGKKILAVLNHSYQLAGQARHSTPSIGATLFAEQGHAVEELLKRADLAMYQSKSAGGNTLRFFDPHMQEAIAKRAALENELRQALVQEQLLLYYQPQVNPLGEVIGAEVLMRWQHPTRGMVSPADFIPLAEATGLILPLGHWALETACRQLAVWHRRGKTRLTLAVNVSARQFGQPDFVAEVLDALDAAGADPKMLKLELTESLLLDDMADIVAKMGQLKARGVSFALDDFGTGYSSLSYLKHLPLDQLKIDQSFVRNLEWDDNDAAICAATIGLAHNLHFQVVAEGVETDAQRYFLTSVHCCDVMQGYLFGAPMSADRFEILAGLVEPVGAESDGEAAPAMQEIFYDRYDRVPG